MLYRSFASALAAAIIVTLGSTASAVAFGSASSRGQHRWVDASVGTSAVSSVHPGYGFSAWARPAYAGGAGSTQIPAASGKPVVIGQSTPSGAIAISARQHEGAQAIDVAGTAPPGTSIEITAQAKLSIDIPVVFLNSTSVVADPSGAFSVTIPIAPDYIPGTEIYILASAPGNIPATVSFVVGAPNSGPPIQSTDVDNGN
jgi:ribosomal protein L30E